MGVSVHLSPYLPILRLDRCDACIKISPDTQVHKSTIQLQRYERGALFMMTRAIGSTRPKRAVYSTSGLQAQAR